MNVPFKLEDQRIQRYVELPAPKEAVISLQGSITGDTREALRHILKGEDSRLAVFVGPCSIHSEKSASEFAMRLKRLQEHVPQLLLIMRFFVQKPRTTVGWTGFLEDPDMDNKYDISSGLQRTIALAYNIVEKIEQPICMELLGTTIEPQYFNNYLSAGFIGARTSESQIHRNLASGVSFPVGIKNPSNGDAKVAFQGVIATRVPRSFCGVNTEGRICAVHTMGNSDTFVVLRGSYKNGSNIEQGLKELEREAVAIVVDCCHGNSGKDLDKGYHNALLVSRYPRVCGIMLESHLRSGNQPAAPNALPDISVTDPCLGWEDTAKLLREVDHIVSRR